MEVKAVLGEELRKLFIKRYILLIVGTFIFIKIILTVLSMPGAVYSDKMQQEKYQYYMKILSGKLTEEKEGFIKQEKKKYEDSNRRVDRALSDFSSGKISDVEYDLLIDKETIYMVNEPVFRDIEKQYRYVKANPNQRYFLDRSGWNALLANEKTDFLLLFCILIVNAVIFNYESESGMSILNLTCKYGRIRMAAAKIGIGLLTSASISILFTLINIFVVCTTADLTIGSYPLQSLRYYEALSENISLLGTLISVSALRVMGCCYAAVIIMCVSVFSNSTIITLFSTLSLTTIPYLMPIVSKIKYLMPFPGGLMTGTGYFRGTFNQLFGDSTVLVSKEITSAERLAFLLAISVLSLVLIFLTVYRYVSKWKGSDRYAD